MKQKLKRIIILLLIPLITLVYFYKPCIVNAKNDQKLVITLPTNSLSTYDIFSNYSIIEYMTIESIYNEYSNQDVWMNSDGKPVLKKISNEENTRFELYEDATEDDCVYDIPDEMRTEAVREIGYDIYEGYNKIQFVLNKIDILEEDTIILDLSKPSNMLEVSCLSSLMASLFIKGDYIPMDNFEVTYLEDNNGISYLKYSHQEIDNVLYNIFELIDISKKDDILSFRLNIPFDKFQENGVVYLDGKEVDSKDYETTEGSTIITFKKEFANKLDADNHTIKVSVVDGNATAQFNIVENSPATGDNAWKYLILLAVGISGLLIIRKKLA